MVPLLLQMMYATIYKCFDDLPSNANEQRTNKNDKEVILALTVAGLVDIKQVNSNEVCIVVNVNRKYSKSL